MCVCACVRLVGWLCTGCVSGTVPNLLVEAAGGVHVEVIIHLAEVGQIGTIRYGFESDTRLPWWSVGSQRRRQRRRSEGWQQDAASHTPEASTATLVSWLKIMSPAKRTGAMSS